MNPVALQGFERLTRLTSLVLEHAPVPAALFGSLLQLPQLRLLAATGPGVQCNEPVQRGSQSAAALNQQLAALSLQGTACTDTALAVRTAPSSILLQHVLHLLMTTRMLRAPVTLS